MKLQQYKDYTVDYRLKQFRKCEGGWENFGPIEFVEFDSVEGERLVREMLAKGLVPDEHVVALASGLKRNIVQLLEEGEGR